MLNIDNENWDKSGRESRQSRTRELLAGTSLKPPENSLASQAKNTSVTRQVKVTIVTSEFQGFHEKSEQAYRLIDKEMENNHRQSQSLQVLDGVDGTDNSEGGQCQRHEHTMEE